MRKAYINLLDATNDPNYNNVQDGDFVMSANTPHPLFILLVYIPLLLPPIIIRYIAKWRLFVKAGEKGWKAIIPFYGTYTLFRLVWDKNVYWFSLIFEILSIVTYIMLRQPFNSDTMIWMILYLVTITVYMAFGIILMIHLAKAYGHNGKFALGLIFVHIVFLCILGFSRAQYIGVQPLILISNKTL